MSQPATILTNVTKPAKVVNMLTPEEAAFVKLVSSNIVSQILNNEKSNNLLTLQQ